MIYLGHPAIRLVDSPQKREYRVLNEKPSTRRGTPPSLCPVAEEATPPPPPPPINSSHDLPLPLPHVLKKESPQSPISKKKVTGHPVSKLKYPQASEGMGSPLNLPSKSRKGLLPKSTIPQEEIPLPENMISPPLPEGASHRQKIRSSIANIWNQTETEFSGEEDQVSGTPIFESSLNTMSPVISSDHSAIPPRAQTGSMSAGIVGHRKLSTTSQRSRSESCINCQEDSMGFILPPPSASPSFPLSLSGGSTTPTNGPSRENDPFEVDPKDYYTLLSPNSTSKADVAPIVPLDVSQTVLPSESSTSEDDERLVDVAVQVSLKDIEIDENKSRNGLTMMRDEIESIFQAENTESLGKLVLQAAEETAYSYQTINSLGGKRSVVFKACQQVLS